jgi:hypothetical protein
MVGVWVSWVATAIDCACMDAVQEKVAAENECDYCKAAAYVKVWHMIMQACQGTPEHAVHRGK